MFTIDFKKKSYEVKGTLRFARDIETNLSTVQEGINQLNGMALLYMGLQSDSINALLNFLYYGIKASERPSMEVIEESLDDLLEKDENALENLFLKAIGVLETSGFFAKMKKMLMENLKTDPNNKELAKQMEQKSKKAISLLSQS
ncbi:MULTISPECIES: tail assembly chaperone [Carnobacterium]|uniref:Phage protein n=1 Tax=Carnobacterium divergens TaxID=2748 RepID=A0A2R7ZZH7_CARDV|nr:MULTISPECIES: tail assembly chaperone [Carnobacterium]MCO6017997.1 tail assembly chaperone [Carnobacterium divergens]MDT1938645.1 tail assembly chaperone [Carnobacterium divergens]MDT1941083.1 tail assembly chaperone [Carnobacterium divergens]MDT1946881.1 tail assembly chaperone [Carnobacterium divergens]MDT1949318.1 tail assembly chaperone [Carnobacterium divergens]